ncbi:Zn-finger in Ran binding protein, partial [Necator americanus]
MEAVIPFFIKLLLSVFIFSMLLHPYSVVMSSTTSKKRVRKEDVAGFDECDAGSWECTVCTYRNRFEAFKCEMCDTRKGTSTRKPR